MKRKRSVIVIALVLLLILAGVWAIPRLARRLGVSFPAGQSGPVDLLLPPGFEVHIFAQGLDRPRFMVYGPNAVLIVADMGTGQVLALPDVDADGVADDIVAVTEGLDRPSSLAFDGTWLYVGETSRVRRLRLGAGLNVLETQIVISDLPVEGTHVTRTVLLGPDGKLYVSVGSSCNVCLEEDPRRAAISVYPAEGGQGRLWATGLRNAVGLALQPGSGALWATNNSRDWLGDDQPQDGIYLVSESTDYGWPRCHNGRIVDPEYGERGDCQGVPPPAIGVQAHSAPLGLTFYDGEQFPPGYWGDLFVAFHGSWNRSVPTGYKIVHLPFEDGQATGRVEDFATGWLQDDGKSAPGRPVGLIVAPDGSLLVSDDRAGLIYRIVYSPAASG